MLKYFFGYHSYFGRVFPIAWVEDNGKAIGGAPHNILFQKELSEDIWKLSLHDLAWMYPLPEDAKPTPSSG